MEISSAAVINKDCDGQIIELNNYIHLNRPARIFFFFLGCRSNKILTPTTIIYFNNL